MATPDQIAALRGLLNDPEGTEFSDDELSDIIDEATTVNGAASVVWTRKAASYSSLVDVSESGSSRKMGDLYKNALAMAKYFGELDNQEDEVDGTGGPIVISRIRRTFA
jgi:hypothetical protein